MFVRRGIEFHGGKKRVSGFVAADVANVRGKFTKRSGRRRARSVGDVYRVGGNRSEVCEETFGGHRGGVFKHHGKRGVRRRDAIVVVRVFGDVDGGERSRAGDDAKIAEFRPEIVESVVGVLLRRGRRTGVAPMRRRGERRRRER